MIPGTYLTLHRKLKRKQHITIMRMFAGWKYRNFQVSDCQLIFHKCDFEFDAKRKPGTWGKVNGYCLELP